MAGRGRGESKNVHLLDQGDTMAERDRQAQLEAARALDIPEGQIPIRGRGGFRLAELRTIPDTATATRVHNPKNVRQVDILANYVQLAPMPDKVIYMYRVEFDPPIESMEAMRRIYNEAAAQAFTKKPIFDGMHECRSAQKLDNQETSVQATHSLVGDQQYKVTFTNTGTVAFGAESLRIYNMHMKEFLRGMGFYQPQTGVYVHPQLAKPIGQDIMMVGGFRTAANIHEGGKTLMNLEAAHKLMQKLNVLQFLRNIMARGGAGNIAALLETELRGKVVVTCYDKKAYRIEEVKTNMNPLQTFDCKGETITYVEYYRRKGQNINDPKQPLLLVLPNNQRRREESEQRSMDIYLVPELCNLAGLTEAQRADGRLKFDLIKASQIAPNERVAHLRQFLQKFHSNEEISAKLNEWGYSYARDGVRLKAFVVPPTKVAYGNMCQQPLDNWQSANPETADIRVNGLAVTKEIKKMVIVCCRNDLQAKPKILENLKYGFDQIQLKPKEIRQIDVQEGDRPGDYMNAIRRIDQDVDCAILIMRGQDKGKYDAIKKAASVERGLITQVVTARLMTSDDRKAKSAGIKIAIQVAAKVGGEPWWTDIPLKNAMVCGYDTYHDTLQRGRSHGAFLASMNDKFSRWWSKADVHDKLEEISAQVAANMVEAVKQYRKFNKNEFPERIIIYRDGVGDGQLEHVFQVELKRILEALGSIGASKKPQLTMIVVNKRIGARFYMRSNNEQFVNPPPGTVIDHTVTREGRYDFYLVSQSTRQGSITPTYYNIIHDECGFPPEIHQKMAYKFCLLYYNWSGTVRVPAPCQYAHKLALLCGEHLHAQPNAVLDDRLHFL